MRNVEEQWLPVLGYEGLYEVSDLGRVRAVAQRRGSRRSILKPGRSGRYVTVSLCRQGKHKIYLVSWVVLEAFVRARPDGHQALHGPGGSLDNRLVNLRWGTPSENAMDRVRDGTDNRGEKHPDAKITAALVTEIRRRYAAGESQRALGEEFGLPGPLVSNAVTGKTWGWLPGAVPADLKRHGLQGESHPSAKLTRDIVRECRARYVMGESTRALAAEFGVKQPSMQKAIAGKTWRDA